MMDTGWLNYIEKRMADENNAIKESMAQSDSQNDTQKNK